MKKEQVLAKLRACGLVAVVRAKDADDAMRIAEACIEGGCAGIELTYTTPGVNAIIEKMAREYDGTDFVIGAGTVMDPETARMAILSGAQYVVSPYFNGDTVRLCNRYRVACMPGAMSIAEVVAGMEAGADIIKVFPGELFGPKVIKAIHGPIPQAEIMPTGGVSVGEKDIFHQALPLAGAERLFWRVKLKPGTPLMFSMLEGRPVLSLSGNPFAAAATFELLARPLLAALAGQRDWEPVTVSAPLATPFPKASGGRRFVRGLYRDGAVTVPEGHSSGQLRSQVGCNCLVDIPAGSPPLEAGTIIKAVLL